MNTQILNLTAQLEKLVLKRASNETYKSIPVQEMSDAEFVQYCRDFLTQEETSLLKQLAKILAAKRDLTIEQYEDVSTVVGTAQIDERNYVIYGAFQVVLDEEYKGFGGQLDID